MNPDDAQLLADLPAWAFASVLLMARAGSACMLFPGIGEAELPTMLRLGFALALVVLLLPIVRPLMPTAPDDLLRAAGMIASEVVTGLWLGWLTRLWLLALPLAGQIAASMAGLANVLQPDPMLGAQTAALARAFALAAPVAILSSGLYALPLSALSGSYELIAPGALLPAGDTVQTVVGAMSGAFALSLRLAAPFVLAGTVWHIALAVLARLVPQFQVYFVAMPGQIVGGIALLGLLAGAMLAAWQNQVGAAFAALPGR